MMGATLGAVVIGFLLYPLLSMAKERGWVDFTNLEIDYEHRMQGDGHAYTIHASGHLNYDDDNEYLDVAYDGMRRSTSSAVDLQAGRRISGQWSNYRMSGGTCTAAGGGGSYGGGGVVHGGDVVKPGVGALGTTDAAAVAGGSSGSSKEDDKGGSAGGEAILAAAGAVGAGEGVAEAPMGAAWFDSNMGSSSSTQQQQKQQQVVDEAVTADDQGSAAEAAGSSGNGDNMQRQGLFARLQSFKVEFSSSEAGSSGGSGGSSADGSPVASGGALREPLLGKGDEIA